jgi:hypothetical protein
VVLGAATPVVLGTAAVAANLTDGNSFPYARGRHLYISNGDDTALTVTVNATATVGPLALAVPDATFTVAAGAAHLFPVLGPEFVDDDGLIAIDYTGADASVTVAALDI